MAAGTVGDDGGREEVADLERLVEPGDAGRRQHRPPERQPAEEPCGIDSEGTEL